MHSLAERRRSVRRLASPGAAGRCAALLLGLLVTAACDRPEEASAPPPVRAVKTVTVTPDGASDERRTFAGAVSAAEVMRLSFAVGGKLLDAPLREGQRIAAGQEAARLDPVDMERRIVAAEARVASARTRVDLADREFRRQEALFQRGFVARAAFDRVGAELSTARADLRSAESDLAAAQDGLARTRLFAPRDGIVTRLLANRFEEIGAGVPVYEVATTAELQAEVLVPERLIGRIDYGARATVSFPALPGVAVAASVSEIAAEAEAGNTFRVKVRLTDAPSGVRSGLTATVAFDLRRAAAGVEIPLSALRFDSTRSEPTAGQAAEVFVLDAEAGVVARRRVLIAGVAGNSVVVTDGLAPGDRVVAAGVALLRDGQAARLWTPPE